jgi:hypothetical protein
VRLPTWTYAIVWPPIACGSAQSSATADGGRSAGDTGPPADAPPSSYRDSGALADVASCAQAVSTIDAAPVGAPCLPFVENDPRFSGFSTNEISVTTNDGQCGSGSCLVNHFRGRVSCPYGQDTSGVGPGGTPGCATPSGCIPVSPSSDPSQRKTVAAQCTDRAAADTVYCSCRCANVDGGTDDAGSYCICPGGLTCVQIISSVGSVNDAVSGAYCIKTGTEWDPASACTMSCNPNAAPCR